MGTGVLALSEPKSEHEGVLHPRPALQPSTSLPNALAGGLPTTKTANAATRAKTAVKSLRITGLPSGKKWEQSTHAKHGKSMLWGVWQIPDRLCGTATPAAGWVPQPAHRRLSTGVGKMIILAA